ncbi:MAG: RNB domain-containing ribonuclease [Victivallales bacterium]|nr:RNB domain-containing ribonuclease [Victivallales bacterium]
MPYALHTIVDIFGNSDLSLGVVVKDQGERIQVQNVMNQVVKIPLRQVLCDYGRCLTNNPVPSLVELQNQISTLQTEIDMELLWEGMRAKPEMTAIPEIAKDYFGTDEKPHLSAIARALVSDSLHFQRNGVSFSAHTPEEVAQLTELRRVRAEKAALKERTSAWLAKVIAANAEQCVKTPLEVPEELEPFVKHCLDYLMRGYNSDAVNILSAATSRLSPRELALSMLRKVNRLPDDADEFLLTNGIHAGFTDEALQFAQALPPYTPSPAREDLTHLEICSIDDEWTREIDDALSLEANPDGSYQVGIHLANPSYFIHKDDLLDQIAAERPLSLYLPTTTVTMFPEHLSCDLASLNAGEVRPAMSFLVQMSSDGEILDWRFCPSRVCVKHRLTYIEADRILQEGDENDSLTVALRGLNRLAQAYQRIREEAGAVSLNRPELKIHVKHDVITVEREDQETPSHNLVREFMVMANYLAAKYALRNDLPIIYRCQEPPLDDVHSVIHYDPIEFDQQVRKMKRTRLSTYPAPHFGLGLDLYAQVSSPLRRYADLVLQRQLEAHLTGQPLPYQQTELFGILDNVDHTSAQNRGLEREAKAYWTLEYLRREFLGKAVPATIVRQEGALTLAELDDFFVRGVVMTRDRPSIGDQLQVRITDVQPKQQRLTLEPAR